MVYYGPKVIKRKFLLEKSDRENTATTDTSDLDSCSDDSDDNLDWEWDYLRNESQPLKPFIME